ncbi:MAG TPA: hypothetical protein VF599_15580 [Pyrinomonadaceae bacterium]|jgi:hypothetical protein
MPATIKDKIIEIKSEPSGTTLNVMIQPKIQNLILAMVQLDEWKDFVEEFIEPTNSNNLKRAQRDRLNLIGHLSDNTYIRQSVAYLFANSVCTGTTRERLDANIGGILDNEIDLNQ